jgi:flagellar L-ring protein precursor FlgH
MRHWILLFSLFFTGCASLQNWFGDNVTDNVPFIAPEPGLKYSESPQAGVSEERQYKRMTRGRMEEESELGASAGSLWQMEGQTSYMFAQNKSRREGDSLTVKLEGPALKQVETKANNIKALLKELEEEEKRRRERNGSGSPLAQQNATGGKKDEKNAGGGRAPATAEKAKEEKLDLTDVSSIQSKIVEKTADGNYRIKGSAPFVIEKKEYKVIVSGIVRPEDYNDAGVSSNKLVDPQYDVVSIRRAIRDEASN